MRSRALRQNIPRRHRIAWTRPAARHLEEIGDYIARDNPPAADRVVNRIRTRTQQLAAHPLLGRAGRVAETRELVVASTPFIVVYRVAERRVDILRYSTPPADGRRRSDHRAANAGMPYQRSIRQVLEAAVGQRT